MMKWEREYRKQAKQWNIEYAQRMNIKELMCRFGELSVTQTSFDEKIERLQKLGERNAARRYKRHLAREARVAKLLARVKR